MVTVYVNNKKVRKYSPILPVTGWEDATSLCLSVCHPLVDPSSSSSSYSSMPSCDLRPKPLLPLLFIVRDKKDSRIHFNKNNSGSSLIKPQNYVLGLFHPFSLLVCWNNHLCSFSIIITLPISKLWRNLLISRNTFWSFALFLFIRLQWINRQWLFVIENNSRIPSVVKSVPY